MLVDTLDECLSQCTRLSACSVVAVDFEGVDLCRDGELLLAQLCASDGLVVLIDVATLGQPAFDAGGLRALLESETCVKLVYDGRGDADCLFFTRGTRMRCVCDCQVLCCASQDAAAAEGAAGSGATPFRSDGNGLGGGSSRLPGLAKALTLCPAIPASQGRALAQLKAAVQPLFVPSMGLGGSYEVWRQRPLSTALVEYSAADVAHLHTLHAAWSHLVGKDAMDEITERRIEQAITARGAAKGPHMAYRDW